MRCQHCGNRISLLRKLKDGEFCSDEHRQLFVQQQQSLAVTRLIDAHEKTPLPPPRKSDSKPAIKSRSSSKVGTRSDSRVSNKKAAAAEPVNRLEVRAELFGPLELEARPQEPNRRTIHREAAEPVDSPLNCALPLRELSLSVCRFARPGQVAIHGLDGLAGAAPTLHREIFENDDASSTAVQPAALPQANSAAVAIDLVALADAAVAETEPPPPHPLESVALAGLAGWSAEWTSGWEPRRPVGGQIQAGDAAAAIPAAAMAPRPAPGAVAHGLSAENTLPAVDFEALAIEEVCSRHRPGLMRLRMPRTRAPKSARTAPPVLAHPLVPLRPSTMQFSGGVAGRTTGRHAAVPRGMEVPWPRNWFSAGNQRMLAPQAEPWPATSQPQRGPAPDTRRASQTMHLAALVSLPLHGSVGRRATDRPELPEAVPAKARPGRPDLFSNPICRLVPGVAEKVEIPLSVRSRRRTEDWRCKPPSRPVISYHWRVVQPEVEYVPECDWVPARTEPVALRFDFRYFAPASGLAAIKPKPFPPQVALATGTVLQEWTPQRRPAKGLSGCANKVFSLDAEMDKSIPHEAAKSPIGVLIPMAPATVRPVPRPSGCKAKADWQRTRWSSVYGSAIWRIAIGRFSGALDQAPAFVRWAALGVAMALAAVAVFPGGRPEAPEDRDWVIAKRADPQPADSGVNAAARPAPRRTASSGITVRPRKASAGAAADESPTAMIGGVFENFQNRLAERAAVAHTDDFRNGLAEWEGAGEWARTWSYDASGFVRTGALALYAPTRGLTDYRMEFLGQIERRSMGWVVRAQNPRNYYAIKLTIVDAGPVPEVVLMRYPVINGVAGAMKTTELPIDVRVDTVYRVLTEVSGDAYSVAVQGKIVDSWNESRLEKGGVGLFSGKGELARVRWVGVWHQYDTLGRLCALLAPSGLPGRERGANQ